MKWTMILLSVATVASPVVDPELAAADPVTSSLMVPLELTIESTSEPILISGTLHIVTQVQQGSLLQDVPPSLKVQTNLVNTTAVGLTTGSTSPVRGSQSLRIDSPLYEEGGIEMIVQMVLQDAYQQSQEDLQAYLNKVAALARLQFDDFGVLTEVKIEDLLSPCLSGGD
jgi:hypothetical protein